MEGQKVEKLQHRTVAARGAVSDGGLKHIDMIAWPVSQRYPTTILRRAAKLKRSFTIQIVDMSNKMTTLAAEQGSLPRAWR